MIGSVVSAGHVYTLRSALISAVADELPAKGSCAIESGDRIGPGLLQMIADGLRPDAGDDIHAFIAAPAGRGAALRPGWEARQMRSHVMLGPPLSGDHTPLGVHEDLLASAAERGFQRFLCGELPSQDNPLTGEPAQIDFTEALIERGEDHGIQVTFPFLHSNVRHSLADIPAAERWNAICAVATAWLPPECANASACHELGWSE